MKPIKLLAILLVNASVLAIMATPALARPKLSQACQQPSPVVDIWSLETMLTKSGVLNDSMAKKEKELAIRDYIKQKNDKYRQCQIGGKTASSCNKPKMSSRQIETNLLNQGSIAQDTKDEKKQQLVEEYRHKRESEYRLCQLKLGAAL
ncbi:hypothetical protein [Shewanella violacea]|uniref:Uncharacterized protein n=1 Tax=Shewanella violacea (strain JCM 10179 / CIP 106290 / LMG 19151 / DSS12) TaxID=637905 RepID=D4ZAN0_SHEVD|nr:hypothetical protein [Shewanella violacea]BAJ03075.1 hypothetical protein SVI_3104 [Shewanella violacea DSS12]